MKIFNYDDTGLFLYESEADPDPLQPGKFLLPARSTSKQVPAIPQGKRARFNETDWALEDIPVPVTPPPQTLEQKKAARWNAIKSERDRRIQNGGYKVGTKWFHSDTFSRTQQMGLVMMGASIPANTPWKSMDATTVVMTQTLAGQIFGTAAASDIAIFAAAETHKAAMEACADPAAYDFSTGCPKAFGE
jgi:hypothetical protein